MPQLIENETSLFAALEADKIRRSDRHELLTLLLPAIAEEVTAALAAANLQMPIFLTVPTSGDTVATLATPHDPSGEDWVKVCELVREIVGARAGIEKLGTRPVPCVAAGMPMGAADLTCEVSQPGSGISEA